MRYIGRSKIGKLHPKRSTNYPMIRLPKQCLDVVGKTAHIYAIYEGNRKGFLVTLEKEATDLQSGAQLVPKVAQPHTQNDVENHLSALESQIAELKLLILKSASYIDAKSKKGAPESGFEPESEPRQGSMIGRYTTRACARKAAA